MALIDPPSPPQQLSESERFVAEVDARLGGLRDSLVSQFNGLMRLMWGDDATPAPYTLTPEQRFAALGNRAVALFIAAAKLKDAIIAAEPTAANRLVGVPAEYSHEGGIVFNADGTVTLNRA